MFQRTIYSGIIGVSAQLAMIGALLPWARTNYSDGGRDVRFGAEAILGGFALLAAVLLLGLVAWFWLDRSSARIKLAALLMLAPAGFLLAVGILSLADTERLFPMRGHSGLPVTFTTSAKEGAYLMAGAGAIALAAAASAALRYRPILDQQAPVLQAACRPWLLGLPALAYLLAVGWAELGGALPDLALPLMIPFNGRPVPLHTVGLLNVLGEPLRGVVVPLAIGGLLAGGISGLARPRFGPAPLVVCGLAMLGFVAFMVYDGFWRDSRCHLPCYQLPVRYTRLGFPSEEEGEGWGDFSVAVEAVGTITLAVLLSIWAGAGIAELLRAVRPRLEEPAPGGAA